MIAADLVVITSVVAIVIAGLWWSYSNRPLESRGMAQCRLNAASRRHACATLAQQEAIDSLTTSVKEHANTGLESNAYMEKIQREDEGFAPLGDKAKPA
jgi:hypothetical protein